MKAIRFCFKGGLVVSLFNLVLGGSIFAQTIASNPIPVVTIQATDPIASGPGDPGTFTVFRAGDTNQTLNVFYRIGGTASNGVDYAQIPNTVLIPAGATSNSITITPLSSNQPSAVKTVVLQLAPSPFLTPVNYVIGVPSNAVVFLTGGITTNIPPAVRIISPANGSVFRAPISIPLFAYANDLDGSVASVEFFEDSISLGFGQPLPLPVPVPVTPLPALDGGAPVQPSVLPLPLTNVFFLVWSNAPVGIHALTAIATDNGGASTTSAPVKVTVLPPLPPPTNRPPIVSIVATDPIAIEGTNAWVWPGETNSAPTWAAWPTAAACFFTNCGPKTATFTVFRFGDTNDDLTVPYDIGGTASNGVDYVALPGSVTIPAGERRALIMIVPIDDGPPDVPKTVVLTMTPSTNAPPDYLLGFPRRAAAIILDSSYPHPVTGLMPDGCFHLAAAGPDAAWFRIDCSTDLVNWTPICTNQVVNGSIDFIDPDAPDNSSRFYRSVPLTDPPPQ